MRQLKITQQITSRESISLVKYLQEVGTLNLIDQEEEVRLANIIQSGTPEESQQAVRTLVEANLRFVISVAKQYQNSGATLDDLIAAGNLGLINAATKFDPSRGFKFISYGVWWIRQSIMQYLGENGKSIRLPLNKINIVNKIRQSITRLEQQYERAPSLEEIAEDMERAAVAKGLKVDKISPADIETLLVSNSMPQSIDMKLNEDSDMNLLDVIKTETIGDINTTLKNSDLQIVLKRVFVKKLSQREQDVVTLYFGLFGQTQQSLEEIGLRFDLTRERVRQIKEKAVRKLKTSSGRNLIREYA